MAWSHSRVLVIGFMRILNLFTFTVMIFWVHVGVAVTAFAAFITLFCVSVILSKFFMFFVQGVETKVVSGFLLFLLLVLEYPSQEGAMAASRHGGTSSDGSSHWCTMHQIPPRSCNTVGSTREDSSTPFT